jgi:hypothetical protein
VTHLSGLGHGACPANTFRVPLTSN